MTKVILYIAVSSDGFIADKQGGVSWLDEFSGEPEDYGYSSRSTKYKGILLLSFFKQLI